MTDSPAGKTDAPAAEPQIPKARLDEALGKTREMETRLAEAMAKLKDLETKTVDKTSFDAVKQTAEQVAADKAKTERQLAAARLANQNQWGEDAATLVLDLQAKGLSAQAAAAAAMADNPALFQKRAANEFRAETHGSLTPQVGAPPVEKPQIMSVRDRMKQGASHQEAFLAYGRESGLFDRMKR